MTEKKIEKNYEMIIKTAMDGFWLVDEHGHILDVNDSYCHLIGYTHEELLRMSISDIDVYEDKKEVQEHLALVKRSGPQRFETKHRHKNGHIVDVEISTEHLEGSNTNFVFIHDLTERHQKEEQIKQNMKDILETQRIAHIGTWRLNLATNQVVWSEELYKMYGFDPALPPPPYTEHMKLFTPESWALLSTSLECTRSSGIPYELELNTVTIDGFLGWMWVRGEAESDAEGNITSLWGAAQDITKLKNAEEKLKASEKKYKMLYTSMTQGLALHEIITDADGKAVDYVFLDINDSYTRLLGVTREMSIGKRITEIMPKVEQYWIDVFGKVALTGEPMYYENHLETTGKYYATYSYSPQKGQFAVLVTDITEQKEYQKNLIYLSYHDQLTGLHNRRFFEEELMRMDISNNLPISIIMFDVNGLKIINDSFGHTFGDELLKKSAEILKKGSRPDDIIARLGGDEFVILLSNTDAHETVQIANNIKELSGKEKILNIELSISYGYDTKTTVEQDLMDVMANAENHMYRHKLYERTSMRSKTIDIIMNTLFEKSNRESEHSKRVSKLCESIASELHFSKAHIDQIRIAGLIHDIGKISVEEKILNTTGRLDNDEWQGIIKHPESGWRILSSSNEFSELAQFVLDHHEKYDGNGYPNGLKGEAIPIEARIIAVADSYDAMTSLRTYKKVMSKEEAVDELLRCSGTHFDPEIVDVFVNKVISDGGRTVE